MMHIVCMHRLYKIPVLSVMFTLAMSCGPGRTLHFPSLITLNISHLKDSTSSNILSESVCTANEDLLGSFNEAGKFTVYSPALKSPGAVEDNSVADCVIINVHLCT